MQANIFLCAMEVVLHGYTTTLLEPRGTCGIIMVHTDTQRLIQTRCIYKIVFLYYLLLLMVRGAFCTYTLYVRMFFVHAFVQCDT